MGIGGGVAAGDCASPSSAWALRQQAASTIKKISHHLHLPNDPRGSSPELSQDLKDAGIVLQLRVAAPSGGRRPCRIYRAARSPPRSQPEGHRQSPGGLIEKAFGTSSLSLMSLRLEG